MAMDDDEDEGRAQHSSDDESDEEGFGLQDDEFGIQKIHPFVVNTPAAAGLGRAAEVPSRNLSPQTPSRAMSAEEHSPLSPRSQYSMASGSSEGMPDGGLKRTLRQTGLEVRQHFLGIVVELALLSEQAIYMDLPYHARFMIAKLTYLKEFTEPRLTNVVSDLGRQLKGEWAQGFPSQMLMYVHFVHFLVAHSAEIRSHMKKPASEQLVDLEFFLSNPELQRKLLKIPYYGPEMVRSLIDIEWRVHKTIHWNRKTYSKPRWRKIVFGGRVLFKDRVYVLLDWQPREETVSAPHGQAQALDKAATLKALKCEDVDPIDAVITPEQPTPEDEAQIVVKFNEVQHIVTHEKNEFVLIDLKGVDPSVEAIIRPLKDFNNEEMNRRVKLDVLQPFCGHGPSHQEKVVEAQQATVTEHDFGVWTIPEEVTEFADKDYNKCFACFRRRDRQIQKAIRDTARDVGITRSPGR